MQHNYEVGYGKPPKKTQFKPGCSGNKKGRPKGSPNISTIVEKLLKEKISITINGKTKKVSCLEAALRQVLIAALNKDAKAQKLLLDLVSKFGMRQEELPPSNEELQQEDIQLLNEIMNKYTQGNETDENPS